MLRSIWRRSAAAYSVSRARRSQIPLPKSAPPNNEYASTPMNISDATRSTRLIRAPSLRARSRDDGADAVRRRQIDVAGLSPAPRHRAQHERGGGSHRGVHDDHDDQRDPDAAVLG